MAVPPAVGLAGMDGHTGVWCVVHGKKPWISVYSLYKNLEIYIFLKRIRKKIRD